MEWASGEIVSVIKYLLPGFVAAWVFFGLTAHSKGTPFERVVQALIFLAIVQSATAIVRGIFLLIGHVVSFGTWTPDVGLVWSFFLAVTLGLLVALFANRNWFHAFLCIKGISKQTSYPSQWWSAFNEDTRYVVLHLKDGRRLYGWPVEWPDRPDKGHFVLVEPAWLLDNNEPVPIYVVKRMLFPASEVRFVEFKKYSREIDASQEEITQAATKLVALQEGNRKNRETESHDNS